jgi:hypothetical protein
MEHMMNMFLMGAAGGLAIGINLGIALGVLSGVKRAANRLREYLNSHELTIHDSTDKPVSLESTLEEALPARERAAWWFSVVVLTTMLVGIALFAAICVFVVR